MKLPIVTVCHDGMYHSNYVDGLIASQGTHYWGGLCKSEMESDVVRHRSKLICQVLQEARLAWATHFLLVDADIGWTASQFERFATLDPELEVLGGCYVKKTDTVHQVVCRTDGDKQIEYAADKDIVTVDRIGFGFIRISRRVLEKAANDGRKTRASWSVVFPTGFVNDTYESEDYMFCHNVIAGAGRVWMDRSTRVTHRGFKTYTV